MLPVLPRIWNGKLRQKELLLYSEQGSVLPGDALILTKCYHNEAAYLTHGGFL